VGSRLRSPSRNLILAFAFSLPVYLLFIRPRRKSTSGDLVFINCVNKHLDAFNFGQGQSTVNPVAARGSDSKFENI
jgi:hypothetical protein